MSMRRLLGGTLMLLSALCACSVPSAVPTPAPASPAVSAGADPTAQRAGPAPIPLPPQPQLAPPRLPRLPPKQSFTHASGARYHLSPRAGDLAVVVMQLDRGALHGAPGVAQLVAQSVARGAASGSQTNAESLAAIGAQLEIHVGGRHTRFELTTTKQNIADAIQRLTRLISRESLAGQSVTAARSEQFNRSQLLNRKNEPHLLDSVLRRALLGGGDPSAAAAGAGTANELIAITLKRCEQFYQRHYLVQNSQIAVVAANAYAQRDTVDKALGQMRSGVVQPPPDQPLDGQVQRSFVVDAPYSAETRLLLGVVLPKNQRGWLNSALLREKLWESARVQLAGSVPTAPPTPSASVAGLTHAALTPHTALLEPVAGRGDFGVLTVAVTVPLERTASAAAQLKNALALLAAPTDAGTLSAMRHRLVARLDRQRQTAQGVAHQLLAPTLPDAANLRQLLTEKPTLFKVGAAVLVARGPAQRIAPLLRPLGEVLVVDPLDGYTATRALMPDFAILHDEAPETAPTR